MEYANDPSVRSAEGVQLGNVCSAAGVAGIWTGAFHEEGRLVAMIYYNCLSNTVLPLIRRSCRSAVYHRDLIIFTDRYVGPFWMWKVVDEDNLSSAFIEAHIY